MRTLPRHVRGGRRACDAASRSFPDAFHHSHRPSPVMLLMRERTLLRVGLCVEGFGVSASCSVD